MPKTPDDMSQAAVARRVVIKESLRAAEAKRAVAVEKAAVRQRAKPKMAKKR